MIDLYTAKYVVCIAHQTKTSEGNVISLHRNSQGEGLENRLYVEYHLPKQPFSSNELEKLGSFPNSDVEFGYQGKHMYLFKDGEVLTPWFDSITLEGNDFIATRNGENYHIQIFEQQ